ncbi:MAG: hypothetical protein HOP16_03650 [Acidobacteria bacterium]|nr:hypothetical protein [Acidobacteriota bacterium]
MQAAVQSSLGWLRRCLRRDERSDVAVWLKNWLRNEQGQDLIEYALLCSAIGLAGVVAFSFVSDAMHDTYMSWDTAVQDPSLVEPCNPAPEPCR